MDVRAAAKRRQAKRLRHAAASRLAALSRATGVSIDLLRTFAGVSNPRNSYRFTVAAFHARGEAAWRQYKRDGVARPVDDVFDKLDARINARRREIAWSVGAELARGTTSVTFPPAPEPGEWEPSRLKLDIKPADFND